MRTPLDKSINMKNIEMREISEEIGNETDEEEYKAYDRDNLIIYEPYRHIESHVIDPTIAKKKMCAIFLVVAIAGLAVGLAVHFMKPPFPSTIQSTISSITTPTTITTKPHETGCDTPGKFFTSLSFSPDIVSE